MFSGYIETVNKDTSRDATSSFWKLAMEIIHSTLLSKDNKRHMLQTSHASHPSFGVRTWPKKKGKLSPQTKK